LLLVDDELDRFLKEKNAAEPEFFLGGRSAPAAGGEHAAASPGAPRPSPRAKRPSGNACERGARPKNVAHGTQQHKKFKTDDMTAGDAEHKLPLWNHARCQKGKTQKGKRQKSKDKSQKKGRPVMHTEMPRDAKRPGEKGKGRQGKARQI
jgi:hypothetical protein